MSVEAQSKWNATAARYNLPAQPEWRQFLHHFELSENFALAVLLVTDADGADLCRVELEKQFQREGKTLVRMDIPDPSALRNLTSDLLGLQLPANAGGLWIAAVAPDYSGDFSAWQAAWQFALARLNPRRNEIRRQFNCSLIFVGAPWLQETMREIAPDLWSVRTLVAKIEPAVGPAPRLTSPEKQSFDAAETQVANDPIFALQEAEKLRGNPDKELALARLLHHAGAGFAARNDWPSAEKAFTEALDLKQRAAAPAESRVATLLELVWTCQILGQADRSLNYAELALLIARQTGNRSQEAIALSYLGLIHDDLGNIRKAIKFHELSLAMAREIDDRLGESNALGNLGNAYNSLGESLKAIEFYEQQLNIVRNIGNRAGEGNALGNLGSAYNSLRDARKAVEFYEQALVVTREIGDTQAESSILGNLGIALFTLGDTGKAIELYRQRLKIAQQMGEKRGEATALGNLGNAYSSLGVPTKAIEFYEQQLSISREINDKRGEAIALWHLAMALNKLDKRIEAITHAEAALKIFETIENPGTDQVRTTLAAWRGQTPPV